MGNDDRLSVLLIDSKDIDRNYYGDRLKLCSSDYVIFHAASGKAGISVCETVSIDCVVLEIDLADMSGFEVLVQLVPTRPPKVPIIVLTHLTNPFLLELAVKNGGANIAQAHRFLGGLYQRAHKDKEAADEFETYLKLDPKVKDAETIKGMIQKLRGQ